MTRRATQRDRSDDTPAGADGAPPVAGEALAHVEPPAYLQELNRVADMIHAVDTLLARIGDSGVVIPLALLEGFERTLVHAHARNLLRLEELRTELEDADEPQADV